MVYADFHVSGSLRDPASAARFRDYGGGGTPTSWVDGKSRLSGGNNAGTRYGNAFRSAQADSALVSIEVGTGYEGSTHRVTVTVDIEILEDVPAFEDCVIQIVLIEDGVVSRGRTFDRSARDILPTAQLAVGQAGETQSYQTTVDLLATWSQDKLSAIAWIHRELPNSQSSREVLNAAQSPLFSETPTLDRSWGTIKATFR